MRGLDVEPEPVVPDRQAPPVVVASDGQHDPLGPAVDLVRALQLLPRRERECLVLRHYLDLSEKEAAATLGVSVGTVKSSTSRGLTALRTTLVEEDNHV